MGFGSSCRVWEMVSAEEFTLAHRCWLVLSRVFAPVYSKQESVSYSHKRVNSGNAQLARLWHRVQDSEV